MAAVTMRAGSPKMLHAAMLETALIAFTTYFATIGPADVAALFAALTPDNTPAERRQMALKGTLIATAILLVFALFGEAVLRLFGISLPALDGIESQHAGERVEDVERRVDRPALLEPRVPTHRDTGEHRDLFAPQADGAAPGAGREPDVLRAERGPTSAEELGEVVATGHRPHCRGRAARGREPGSARTRMSAPFPVLRPGHQLH